jgi:Xaa-Pro aminopeptidase
MTTPSTPAPGGGAFGTEIVFPREEYDRRLGVIHAELARDGLDAVLVLGPENIFYLTGYETIGYSSFQVAVVPACGEPRLLVRELERDAAVALNRFPGEPASYDDDTDPPQALIGLLAEMGLGSGLVGFDPSSPALPVRHFTALTSALPSLRLVPATPVEHARVIKSELEIACIRQSARYAEAGIGAALDAIREGATDNAVSAAASVAILAAGSEYLTIDPIVTTGHRSGIAHTTFARQRIGPGDAVLLEMAGSHRRYPGALMRTAVVGPPSDLARRMYDACNEGLDRAIAVMKPGVRGRDVHQACQQVIDDAGFERNFRKRLGYSVGVAFAPDWGEGHIFQLSRREERELRPGMAFHLPPALREYDVLGVGVSETVLVTETGAEVITSFPRDLRVK